MKEPVPKLIATDLDGTLLNDEQQTSLRDYKTLRLLGDMDITRVIATGRSTYSFHKVIPEDFPIDFLVFSSGAGIYDWKTKKILHSYYINSKLVNDLVRRLIELEADFMVHEIIPDNHKFVYHKSSHSNPDFERRLQLYSDHAEPLDLSTENFNHACQILIVISGELDFMQKVSDEFPDTKIIRATSPLDKQTVWMEIFPHTVSKGKGVAWICDHLGIDHNKTLSIGNDYNDLDLLRYAKTSYVVSNSPAELKAMHPVVTDNNHSAFTEAVAKHVPGIFEA
ncbi:MAG: Cof-type HAD-IIB family hydrolase [Bacteroidales bacterium]|nr:Cof-type HAD-IIB family hydrolase [Bacteroidales bacterium]